MKAYHNLQKKGRSAEQVVARLYQKYSWTILEKNYRCTGSEIDIIAQKNSSIVFIEVKFRKEQKKTHSKDIWSIRKQRALQRGALHFITNKKPCYESLLFALAIVYQRKDKTISLCLYNDIQLNC
jgi:putative endonuclease